MTSVTDRANSALMAALNYSSGQNSTTGAAGAGGNTATNSPLSNAMGNADNTKLLESTLNSMGQILGAAGKLLEQAGKLLNQADHMGGAQQSPLGAHNGNPGCFPTAKPSSDTSESGWGPTQNLKTDKDGKITTPGGYTIEQMGQFEWKVTGPDKKETRVWGDPHVSESDGGEWQFKKNTEFVLGDGTRIDVTTKPYGNGATVTGQLDIVNGDSHVSVTDIDKGKGKVGDVKTDGNDSLWKFNAAGADRVTMGKTTADWNHDGREIIGSDAQGETLKTKDEPGVDGHVDTSPNWNSTVNNGNKTKDALGQLSKTFESLSKLFAQMEHTQSRGFNPFRKQDDFGKYDRNQHQEGLKHAFKSVGNMLQTLQRQLELNGMLRQRGSNIS